MAVDRMVPVLEREMKGMEQERADLCATGDLMQSALSRILEWARTPVEDGQHDMPYEVAMACLEGQSAVDLWTEVRRKSHV